jgi:hypothetical protein
LGVWDRYPSFFIYDIDRFLKLLPERKICSVFFFLTGCVEKSGYYEEGEDNIISLICDVV